MNCWASPQTAKFNEPVTLDFLDAELENAVKVEVRNPAFGRCQIGISTFYKYKCFRTSADKEKDDRRVEGGLLHIHPRQIAG